MTPALALRTAAVLAATLAAAALARPAATRRDLLTLGLLATLALPLLGWLPSWSVPALPAATAPVLAATTTAGVALQEPAGVASGPAPAALLGLLWALGALAVAVRTAVDLGRAGRLVATATPADPAWTAAADEVGVLVRAQAVPCPMVVGLVRPVVLVPPVDWSHGRRVRALRHERAHVASRDNLRLLLARVVTTLHWFDPLAWLAARRLRLALEQAADDAVVADGADATTYAGELVDLGRALVGPTAALGGRPLDQRVRSLLAPSGPGSAGRRALLVGAVAALALGVGTLGTAAADPAPDVDALVRAEVAELVATWSPDAVAIVVLDVASGAVVVGEHGDGAADRALAPGSVVKPFVAVAALDAGVPVDRADLRRQLEVSSNPGFVALADAVGAPLADALRAQGLPAPAAPAADLALGQFPVTTRQLAAAYAKLGERPNGRVVRELLTAVVHGDEGTGRKAAVSGRTVAGKTGTALLDPSDPERVLASFVGMVPADDPRWVVAVQVADPGPSGWGGRVAAPAFARIAGQLP